MEITCYLHILVNHDGAILTGTKLNTKEQPIEIHEFVETREELKTKLNEIIEQLNIP